MGADSALWQMEPRRKLWHKLATDWKIDDLESISQMIGLDELDEHVAKILKGQIRGRAVVEI